MDLIYYYLPALETIRDFMELGGGRVICYRVPHPVHVDTHC